MKDIRVKNLEENWKSDERWKGIERPYSAEKVIGLRGSIDIEHTLARRGAEKLELIKNRAIRSCLRSFNRKSSSTTGKSRVKSNLLKRVASSCRCKSFRKHVS